MTALALSIVPEITTGVPSPYFKALETRLAKMVSTAARSQCPTIPGAMSTSMRAPRFSALAA